MVSRATSSRCAVTTMSETTAGDEGDAAAVEGGAVAPGSSANAGDAKIAKAIGAAEPNQNPKPPRLIKRTYVAVRQAVAERALKAQVRASRWRREKFPICVSSWRRGRPGTDLGHVPAPADRGGCRPGAGVRFRLRPGAGRPARAPLAA